MQDWILSDTSVNSRDFCSKEESLLRDGNSVLELYFLWPVWTLGFWSAVKMVEESNTLKQDDSQLNLLRFWERGNADQMLFYSTDYFKILHWALVIPAIPRLEVFLICWKYVLQGVGGSGKENCPSLKGFHIQGVRLLIRMRKGDGIKAFERHPFKAHLKGCAFFKGHFLLVGSLVRCRRYFLASPACFPLFQGVN